MPARCAARLPALARATAASSHAAMLLGKGMDIPLRQAQGRAGNDLARRQDLQRQRFPAAADDPQLRHGRTACQTRSASAALPT